MLFETAIECFPWESEVQKKGYLALVQYLRKFGIEPQVPVDYTAAFFVQKDHESNLWFMDVMAQQISSLKDEISRLLMAQEESNLKISQLQSKIESLTSKQY